MAGVTIQYWFSLSKIDVDVHVKSGGDHVVIPKCIFYF
jgi:hypothetical protein